MSLHQSELAYGVVSEEEEELHPFDVHFVVVVASLNLFLIHGGDDVVLFLNLMLYFRDLLLEKWRY